MRRISINSKPKREFNPTDVVTRYQEHVNKLFTDKRQIDIQDLVWLSTVTWDISTLYNIVNVVDVDNIQYIDEYIYILNNVKNKLDKVMEELPYIHPRDFHTEYVLKMALDHVYLGEETIKLCKEKRDELGRVYRMRLRIFLNSQGLPTDWFRQD